MIQTQHAKIRVQQRGVPEDAISFIMNNGKQMRTKNGCIKKYFDKGCLLKIKYNKNLQNIFKRNDKQIMSTILIFDPINDTLVTVIHPNQSKKLRWN
ncbi:MAG: hypothetical protein H8E92_03020 [SAR86 cluster bacterium]|nr:hypothetical protein [SAR86 cluster bacterium]